MGTKQATRKALVDMINIASTKADCAYMDTVMYRVRMARQGRHEINRREAINAQYRAAVWAQLALDLRIELLGRDE